MAGEIDISKIVPFEGIFSQLKDIAYFATVRVAIRQILKSPYGA